MQGDIHHPLQPSFFEFTPEPWDQDLHAGVDEVGIGPLAGPVVAGAVLLDPSHPIDDLADSKTLTAAARTRLAGEIRERALGWALGWAQVEEIDRYNILRASHLAMQRAVTALGITPVLILVDGNKAPHMGVPVVAVVQGDRRIPQIGAASIIAKVARDEAMCALDAAYPGYGFARHKGYPTRAHCAALRDLGPCPAHRRTFAPVRDAEAASGPSGERAPGAGAAQSDLLAAAGL